MNQPTELTIAPRGKQDLFTLAPKSLAEAMEYSKIIADSGMVPAAFKGKPGDILVAVQMGAEVGLPPTQALQNIAVINGRPSLWGDAVIAVCRRSPLCESIREWSEGDVAYCETKRRDEPDPILRSFSMDDAKKAGLANKAGPWTQYPKRMMQMRARGFCLRDAYPDVLRGLRLAEEEQDREPVVQERDVTPAPRAQTATAALRGRLGGRAAPTGPDTTQAAAFHMIKAAVEKAETREELDEAVSDISGLTEEQTGQARDLFKARRDALKLEQSNRDECVPRVKEEGDCLPDFPRDIDPATGEVLQG